MLPGKFDSGQEVLHSEKLYGQSLIEPTGTQKLVSLKPVDLDLKAKTKGKTKNRKKY